MFPNFRNKADRESKRQSLLNQYTKDLQDDESKRQAYAEAMWTSDVEKNKINLLGRKADMNTGTDPNITGMSFTSSSSGTSQPPSSGTNPGVFSEPGDPSSNTGRPYLLADQTSDSARADTTESPDEEMKEEQDPTGLRTASQSSMEVEAPQTAPLSLDSIKERIKQAYTNMPSLATLRINPIPIKEGDRDVDDKVYFGPSGELYSESTRKQLVRKDRLERLDEKIDWAASLHYIESKGLGSIAMAQKFNEFNNKYLKDNVMGALYKNYVTNIDERYNYPDEETKDDNSQVVRGVESMYRYSMNMNFVPGSDEDIMAAIDTLVVNNRDLVQKYPIVAIKKDGLPVGEPYKFSPLLLEVVTKRGTRTKETQKLTSEISWKSTFDAWKQKLSDNKVNDLDTAGTNVKYNKKKRGLADSTSSLRPDNARVRLSPTNQAYQTRIRYIFTKYPALVDSRIPITVSDAATGHHQFDQLYLWGPNGVIIDRQTGLLPKNMDEVLKRVAWGRSYTAIRQIINYGLTDLKQRGEEKEYKSLKRVMDGADAISLTGDVDDDMAQAFSATRGKGMLNLKGRGLIGAGVGLKGYSGTSKNLRSIQGSGTASDLKYKQLGSKFIRMTDLRLDQPKLKLVYANRTQVGRMVEISKSLAKVIETLVFDQNVDQQSYNKLTVNDKQIVHDLLRLCHLETTLRDPPAHPLNQLQAEFDKLRSQVMLGNDNPANLREVKALSLDLYNNHLLTDAQMRSILDL